MFDSALPLPLFGKGKVRDTYDLGENLLIVATDRISAFDVVLANAIPCKGKVLNQLSAFWFARTAHLVPNHVVAVVDEARVLPPSLSHLRLESSSLVGRSMIVRKARQVPVECVVRGYLSGSAWEEYREKGTACGLKLPGHLKESEKLPEPIFTPTTKAESGHDMPLTRNEMVKLIGQSLADEVETRTKAVYAYARDQASDKGIIIADTKMEFGMVGGNVILTDELLTPDSSRFWEASQYKEGQSQPSYDKQPVRDWLVKMGWDKKPPAPLLSDEVVRQTAERYCEAYRRLTGAELA
ncbi:MAG: phosphoribosylaminoimidazolesuccinocarboxamide synthase [Chloroflexi bacterium]|nr:phosphoribosylaminoimidazolesuccinocarboxamide synthase [Chloroflexota bacterium]